MMISFSKKKIIESVLSPYDHYCVGYSGKGNYLAALVIAIGVSEKKFFHSGSRVLDKILAYDNAEVSGAYIGQINMSLVSSFVGPQGLVWGYDIAKEEGIQLPSFFTSEKLKEFGAVRIKSGENLRRATVALFGTNEERHFPLLPGSHVPCAGRFYIKSGPAILYGAIAIGIPKNREKMACLLMEDAGEIIGSGGALEALKEKIMSNLVKSVIKVGKNQKVEYQEIFVDFVHKKIASNEIGCALVSMPYFLLAKKAFTEKLIEQGLEEWQRITKKYFLCNQDF